MKVFWAVVGIYFAVTMVAFGHDSWISQQQRRNQAGEWCCGDGDCAQISDNNIHVARGGYNIQGQQIVNGSQKNYTEIVPYNEVQPSPDGKFWRCKRPDGSRRCFFGPPPSF
jgi:hypothetical protein